MVTESKHDSNVKPSEAQLLALYEQMKEGGATPSAALQRQLVFDLLEMKIAKLQQVTGRLKLIRNVLRISALAFSALATVALGLKHEWLSSNGAQNIALILTAGATFFGSIAALWDIESYWLRNKVMLNRLRQLRYRFAFAISSTASGSESIKPIFEEILDIVGDEYWEKTLNRSMELRRASNSVGGNGGVAAPS